MRIIAVFLFIITSSFLQAQLDEACKLEFGTNLGGLVDFGTELPFVNLMHNAREWYTKDIDNPTDPFNSEQAQNLSYRSDGYPTHVPQSINESDFDQRVITIWGITDGWPIGQYTVLWEGTGELRFWGAYENVEQTDDNRMTFDVVNPLDNVLEMTILTSDINDPIHNIRILMPGTESTYETEPFNPLWLEKLSIFPSVRFMDWGMTNSWGQPDTWTWDDPSLFDWQDRAQVNNYTWANSKGIPYEMMIKLLNDFDLDGWVCVPHRASDNYIENMARLFEENLEAERHLTVEYSNEIWNWIFGQAQWLNKYGCELQNVSWPEGIVPYVQNCLDIWSDAYEGELERITRVAGVQASWQDVSNRMVNNLREGSFDAITPTFYFGFSDEGDTALDNLGANTTVEDIAFYARQGMEDGKLFLTTQKNELADPLGLPMIFYEGGQHLTGHPFGEEPSYSQALLDIQRDTAMYNLYNEWFNFIRTLQEGEEPIQLMNFSFIAGLSSRFGSWGILETMDQDTAVIPAPKYSAILAAIEACDLSVSTNETAVLSQAYEIFPNPASDFIQIVGPSQKTNVALINSLGQVVRNEKLEGSNNTLDVSYLKNGSYYLHIENGLGKSVYKIVRHN